MSGKSTQCPRVIIGLGNPGPRFAMTRHNIGFEVVDALAERMNAEWREKSKAAYTQSDIQGHAVLLVKSLTFMNNTGEIVPDLKKQGYSPEDVLVVQDELDLDFGTVKFKYGGSARGHNGIRSLIAAWGDKFDRLRVGVGRPEQREQVHEYVLQRFTESPEEVRQYISQVVDTLISLCIPQNHE